jgi:hypothetical protein
VVEGEEVISNFTGSFGEMEKLLEILENWNDQLVKIEPNFEIAGRPASASGAASGFRS